MDEGTYLVLLLAELLAVGEDEVHVLVEREEAPDERALVVERHAHPVVDEPEHFAVLRDRHVEECLFASRGFRAGPSVAVADLAMYRPRPTDQARSIPGQRCLPARYSRTDWLNSTVMRLILLS